MIDCILCDLWKICLPFSLDEAASLSLLYRDETCCISQTDCVKCMMVFPESPVSLIFKVHFTSHFPVSPNMPWVNFQKSVAILTFWMIWVCFGPLPVLFLNGMILWFDICIMSIYDSIIMNIHKYILWVTSENGFKLSAAMVK